MSIQITDSLYSVGVLNPNMRVFDIVMRTEYGTSYNSYVVKGTEKTALIETCHHTFFDAYLANVRAVCDPSKLDYIVLNHTEPDHSGALRQLLDIAPNAQVVCSRAASIYLRAITNCADLNVRVVGDGEELDLGGGKILRFMNAPFLHWPDSMFTWFEAEKTLFSCDFFGAHYCEPLMFDTSIVYPKAYDSALRNYFDAIFGPFKPYVLKGLDKLEGLDITRCCTSHGPILTKEGLLARVMDNYRTWAQPCRNVTVQIPIFYCTAYGNTRILADALRKGILVALPRAEVTLYDMVEHDASELGAVLAQASGFLIGSPTINRDAVPPVWQLLSHVDAINCQKKPASAFGSFGWSGEAVGSILSRLQQLKFAVYGEGLKVNFVPNEEDLGKAKAFGTAFAQTF